MNRTTCGQEVAKRVFQMHRAVCSTSTAPRSQGGRQAGLSAIRSRLVELEATLPALLLEAITEQLSRIGALD